MKRWQIFLLVVLAVVVIGGAGYIGFQGTNPFVQNDTPEPVDVPSTVAVSRGEVKQTIITPGQLDNFRMTDVLSGTTGPVISVNVRPGQAVQTGEVMVRLGGLQQLELNVANAEIALLEAQNNLDDLTENADLVAAQAQLDLTNAHDNLREAEYRWSVNQSGNRASSDTINAVEANLVLANQAVDAAQSIYNQASGEAGKAQAISTLIAAKQHRDSIQRNLNWYTGKPTDIQQAQLDAEVALAAARVSDAERNYKAVNHGPDPVGLALAQAHLETAQHNLRLAEANLQGSQITAPYDGVVLAVSVQEGEMVGAGSHVLQMADPHALEVLISIVEEDYPLVEVGQPVDLYFDAVPEVVATGKVDRIVPKRVPGSLPLYHVYISIDDVPEMVVDGMTADAEIILAHKSDVLVLPRALVKANSDGTSTVSVWIRDRAEDREVTVGLRGDVFIEILSGLAEGELVVGG